MSEVRQHHLYQRLIALLPDHMIRRFRLVVMVLAITSSMTIWPDIMASVDVELSLRLLQIVLMTAVFLRWMFWYLGSKIRPLDLVLELSAVFAVTYLLPESSTALAFAYTGVYFRPLMTNNRETAIAAGGYAAAYFFAAIATSPDTLAATAFSAAVNAASLLLGAVLIRIVASSLEQNEAMTYEITRTGREYRTLVENLPGIVISFDTSGVPFYVSPQCLDILGYTPEEYIQNGKAGFTFIHEDERKRVLGEFARCLHLREDMSFEFRIRHGREEGSVRWVRFEGRLLESADGCSDEWRGILTDVTEQHELAEQLAHQAFHDNLTGLPNRAFFTERLDNVIAQQAERPTLHAVMFLDLDNFKVVNDSLGHTAGDKLLVIATQRILNSLRPGDTVARMGGDEFAILLNDLPGREDAIVIADRIQVALNTSFKINGYAPHVSVSIGIAFNQSAGVSSEDLIRRADVAMYEAKQNGKDRHVVFTCEMEERAWTRLQNEEEIRAALAGNQFRVCYQPVVDLLTGKIREIEALVRWEHPTRGTQQPDDFLPLLEEIGMMATLDRWVLEQACRQTREWQLRYPEHATLIVSVNLSPAMLQAPDLAATVEGILNTTGLRPDYLRLEVTENTMLDDIERAQEAIHELHRLGVHLAIDDFGTGNSALSYLRKLPVDTLKIDRSYVADMDDEPDGLNILAAVIQLGRSLGLQVTAEGIEQPHQAGVYTLGCDLGQGYYFSRPVPAGRLDQLLRDEQRFSHHIAHEDDPAGQTVVPLLRAGRLASAANVRTRHHDALKTGMRER